MSSFPQPAVEEFSDKLGDEDDEDTVVNQVGEQSNESKPKNLAQLANGPVFRTLLKISIPSMIGFTSSVFSNTVQSIVIGEFLGDESLTGHSNFLPTENFFFGEPGAAVASGAATLISDYMGRGKYEEAARAEAEVYIIAIFLAVLLPLIFLPWLPTYLSMLGVTETIMPYSLAYGYPIAALMPCIYSMNNLSAILRCENRAIVAMSREIYASMCTLALTCLFVIGLKKTLSSVAWALITSFSTSATFLITYLSSAKSTIRLRCKYFKPEWHMIGRILYYGITQFANASPMLLYSLLATVLLKKYSHNAQEAERLELIAGISSRILNLYQVPLNGFMSGMEPLLGYSLGMCDYRRTFEVILKEYQLLVSVGATLFVLIMCFARSIVAWFTSTSELYAEATRLLRVSVSGVLLQLFLQVQCVVLQQERRAGMSAGLQMIRVAVCLAVQLLMPAVTGKPEYIFYSTACGDIVGGTVGVGFTAATFVKYRRLKARAAAPGGAAPRSR